jgi:flagellar protein FliL
LRKMRAREFSQNRQPLATEAQKGPQMSETKPQSGEAAEPDPPPPKRRRKFLFILLGTLILLSGGAAAAWQFVPGLAEKVKMAIGHGETATIAAAKPVFIDLPEMAVTLPNAGHPRQMRIRMSVELAKGTAEIGAADVLSPRVYDALLTYLRTLREGEVDGGLGLDRLRADLFRRLDLIMGSGVLRDVLITSLVLA